MQERVLISNTGGYCDDSGGAHNRVDFRLFEMLLYATKPFKMDLVKAASQAERKSQVRLSEW